MQAQFFHAGNPVPITRHKVLTGSGPLRTFAPSRGAIAQLGERLHGMQEVGGSIPPGSTSFRLVACTGFFHGLASPSSRGLGHHPFTVRTGVRIPVGTPS